MAGRKGFGRVDVHCLSVALQSTNELRSNSCILIRLVHLVSTLTRIDYGNYSLD